MTFIFSVPNVNIGWNQIVNTEGKSDVSDVINIYDSSGTGVRRSAFTMI